MFRKNIVVVGGGTAGWLTALHVKRLLGSDVKVSLIESEDIGIVGVGEGSTPFLSNVFNELGIDYTDFIVSTNATHKMGIYFENWNGDGENYFHSFNSFHHKYDYIYDDTGMLVTEHIGYLLNNDYKLDKFDITSQLSLNHKSPYMNRKIDGYDIVGNFSFHFDAHLAARYLRKFAEKKRIERIEGIVVGFNQDDKGFIRRIKLKSGKCIPCDFVFDCTGFHRLIIGKLFDSPWKSYMNQLKVKQAITFQIPQDSEKIKPYTRAISMKYGWMWMIPLQNRIGCGYNYDTDFITADEAQKEVEEFLGMEINIGKKVDYNAGAYEKVWIKNCIAVGLSSGFTEPIEATSIFNALNQLYFLNRPFFTNFLQSEDEYMCEIYNKQTLQMNDDVLDFLYTHYITKRNDTEFWKTYLDTTKMPESLETLINTWNTEPLELHHLNQNPFGLHGWYSLGVGLGFLNKDVFSKIYEESDKERLYNHHEFLTNEIESIVNDSYDEKEYLNKLKNDKTNYF